MLNDPLFIAAIIACGLVGLILARGIASFGKEGLDNAKRSNKFMRWRLMAQFAAVVLILLFVYLKRQTG